MKDAAVKPTSIELRTEKQKLFVEKSIQRKTLFLTLSIAGVAIGLLLAIYDVRQSAVELTSSPSLIFVVFILILLNARQNRRQHKYVKALEVRHSDK